MRSIHSLCGGNFASLWCLQPVGQCARVGVGKRWQVGWNVRRRRCAASSEGRRLQGFQAHRERGQRMGKWVSGLSLRKLKQPFAGSVEFPECIRLQAGGMTALQWTSAAHT
jgi:hypothetical protein